MQQVLIPTFTLTAATANGSTVRTNVSLNEAAFLTGVFSQDVVLSDFAAAQAAVMDEMRGLSNGTVAFILPGTQILIFPVGAIITSFWLFLGLCAYGYGTYQRINYAESYRQRSGIARGKKTF